VNSSKKELTIMESMSWSKNSFN